ncbi:hypothetical protein F7725_003214 [Dissostichus mawsoni]|uniref:ER membrane protein complex subunit 10 n=1 Tax=Dissostichus mawsoni TaxID=36200 RepID=A0A7J5Y9J6_DISMA|nr:hypothetical protein F7725_003214 [Dissostichus mawsoni]
MTKSSGDSVKMALPLTFNIALFSTLFFVLFTDVVFCNNGRRVGDVMDTEFGGFSVPLEHSFEVDDVAQFRVRGALVLKAGREPSEVAAVDGLYRIRVPRVFLQADRQTERQLEGYLTAFVRACAMVESHLSDVISFHTDVSGTSSGPETALFLERMEMETEKKGKNPQEQKSFFAKYELSSSWSPVQHSPQQGEAWMYIVPLVLFLMMSGAQDQSGGGAGGGAANGGGR